MMWNWDTGWSWWGWGMSLSKIIFWGLVIWGIVLLVRYLTAPRPHAASSDVGSTSPDSILAERFARGEIGDREYTRKREKLRSDDPGVHSAGIEDRSQEREIESVAH
jgi:putative membrane protein